MEYIGVSLNNVIPQSTKYTTYDEDESETSESEDDGVRKSKKRALKYVYCIFLSVVMKIEIIL